MTGPSRGRVLDGRARARRWLCALIDALGVARGRSWVPMVCFAFARRPPVNVTVVRVLDFTASSVSVTHPPCIYTQRNRASRLSTSVCYIVQLSSILARVHAIVLLNRI